MRLGWLPSTRAGVLGTRGQCYRAQGRQLRAPPPSRRPTTQNTEMGVGFGPEHLQLWAAPERRASPSVWGRLRACTDLAGRAASGAWRPRWGWASPWRGRSQNFCGEVDLAPTSHCCVGYVCRFIFNCFSFFAKITAYLQARGVFLLHGPTFAQVGLYTLIYIIVRGLGTRARPQPQPRRRLNRQQPC